MANRKPIKIFFSTTLLATFLLTSFSCYSSQWIFFHGDEIKGYVVDAETGEFIEGAIVIAMWQLSQIASEGFGGYAKLIEIKTDKDGKFIIPSWRTVGSNTANSVMHELAPKIIIYKPGYKVNWSHKLMREGFPDDYSMTTDEKKKAKEKYSVNPTKLKRIHMDDEICKEHSEFRSQANFPDKYYSKKQIMNILDVIEIGIMQLPKENNFSKKKILMDIKDDRKYWMEDMK